VEVLVLVPRKCNRRKSDSYNLYTLCLSIPSTNALVASLVLKVPSGSGGAICICHKGERGNFGNHMQ
jgi:hypothetical protein